MLASERQTGGPSVRMSPNTAPVFAWLRTRELLDARGYAMAPLRQRVIDRMSTLRCPSVEAYVGVLASDATERAQLLAELLESRSAFGTDAGIWRAVTSNLAASSMSRAALRGRFHAWSVGCATGEEAFTLAMMFAEAYGLDRVGRHVEIVATDIDSRALEIATAATYEPASVASLPTATVTQYFDAVNGAFVVKEELRRAVRFVRHDLLRDETLKEKHLIVCRELAPAFSVAGRRRATRRLVRALSAGGLLVFGRGEWPEVGAHLETIDPVRGIYRRADDGGMK